VASQYAEAMFLPTDDRERKARIIERMTAVPQHVLASSFEQGWSCDLAAAAAACKVPALCIQAANPHPELERFGQPDELREVTTGESAADTAGD
jgi:hypothetical protein